MRVYQVACLCLAAAVRADESALLQQKLAADDLQDGPLENVLGGLNSMGASIGNLVKQSVKDATEIATDGLKTTIKVIGDSAVTIDGQVTAARAARSEAAAQGQPKALDQPQAAGQPQAPGSTLVEGQHNAKANAELASKIGDSIVDGIGHITNGIGSIVGNSIAAATGIAADGYKTSAKITGDIVKEGVDRVRQHVHNQQIQDAKAMEAIQAQQSTTEGPFAGAGGTVKPWLTPEAEKRAAAAALAERRAALVGAAYAKQAKAIGEQVGAAVQGFVSELNSATTTPQA